jgi:hypothetical protein
MIYFYALTIKLTIKSNTFNNIEQNANEVWEFNNFKLIYSYRLNVKTNFFPAPPPFNIINLPQSFFIFLYSCLGFNHKIFFENRVNIYGKTSDEEYSLTLGLF